MYIKYRGTQHYWNLIEYPTDIRWTYRYMNVEELKDAFAQGHVDVSEVLLGDPGAEPPANGYRILELCWETQKGVQLAMHTNLPCFLVNESGKTVENLTP